MTDAAQIYLQSEYVVTAELISARIAIKKFPATKVITLKNGTTEDIYETFMTHLDDLQEVYESLIDEESKKTFCGYWLGKISNRLGEIVYSNAAHYLINGFIPKAGAVAIDCGAYDGMTSLRFVNMGCKVYGFEMDRKNFERSSKLAAEKNFVVENLGLGYYRHETSYAHAGAATKINLQGSETAQIITLDSYVGEKNLPRVDFIKMDVEGAELDILKGAAITIAKYKPILALSAYHRLDDFWTLTRFIKSIRPDYEFAMRQYATTPEDLADWLSEESIQFLTMLDLEVSGPNYEECVLFAR